MLSIFPSGRFAKSSPAMVIMRPSSRVVRTTSTSRTPLAFISGRCASYFFAVQGITETTKMSSGRLPIFSAKYVLATAPNICCGDLHVEMLGRMSG